MKGFSFIPGSMLRLYMFSVSMIELEQKYVLPWLWLSIIINEVTNAVDEITVQICC
jgi:hypothetical protein